MNKVIDTNLLMDNLRNNVDFVEKVRIELSRRMELGELTDDERDKFLKLESQYKSLWEVGK